MTAKDYSNITEEDIEKMDNEEFLAYMDAMANEPMIIDENNEVIEEPQESKEDESKEKEELNEEVEEESLDNLKETDDNIDEKTEEENVEAINSTHNDNKDEEFERLKKEYEELKQFKEAFNKKVVIDGVELPAIQDPDILIDMQQKFVKYQKDLDKYNKNRGVIETLEKSGLLEDKKKLALLMDAAKGDPDAIKTILKENEINPFDLDIEEFKGKDVNPDEYFTSPIELKFQDFVETSKELGVDEKLSKEIIGSWDNNAIVQLLEDDASKNIILEHLRTGSYDRVKEKIVDNIRKDFTGQFKNKNAFEQYVIASNQLAKEYNEMQQKEPVVEEQPVPVVEEQPVIDEKKPVEQERIKKAKKASKSSEQSSNNNTEKVEDLSQMSNEDFLKFMHSMI